VSRNGKSGAAFRKWFAGRGDGVDLISRTEEPENDPLPAVLVWRF